MAERYADVAVIGGGAAGIAAARMLVDCGLGVTMIEAMPRLGGRGWTRQAAGLPLDLGCGWLHSADRNPWTPIAEASGYSIDRHRPAWGKQYCDLGFPHEERDAAQAAFARWSERIRNARHGTDRACDLIDPDGAWTPYLQTLSGFISGDDLERISIADYAAYDKAATQENWRVVAGFGTLIAASVPERMRVKLSTPVTDVRIVADGVALETKRGTIRTCAAVVTVSTNVLAGDAIRWPTALDPWRDAARRLPLGTNEKLFLEIAGDSPFAPESHVLGDPHDAATGAYYIRPFGWPVIECFLGGKGARHAAASGAEAAFARAIDQIAGLFGSSVRGALRPLIASDWTNMPTIGGAYSHALPGCADARLTLANSFDDRLFFAGEATHMNDFSTAHGALESGRRAAADVVAALTRRCR